MGKIFLVGDIHIALGYPNNVDKWYKIHVEYFENFLIPFLRKNVRKEDIIVFLGDLFDNRDIIPINLLNYVMSIIEEISLIAPLHILIGNHDCWNKSTSEINTLKPFKYIPNVFIYDKTDQIEFNGIKLCMMPYIDDKDEQIEAIKNNINCEYLFCHSDLNGARMHLTSAAHRNKNKIDIDEFNNFRKVYSGHIHIRQSFENFTFVGSIFEMDRNDIDNEKGIYILDTNDNSETFIVNDKSPRFKKVYIRSENDLEQLTDEFLKNWVDVFISNKLLIDNKKLRRKIELILRDNNFSSVEYIDDINEEIINEEINLEEALSINFNFREYIENYINSQSYDDEKIKNGLLKELENIIEIFKDKGMDNLYI